MGKEFASGDLVWAKMKGFPPWPASITACPRTLREGVSGNGKYTVTFFGTKETAIMKVSELFPYFEHRHSFEKDRKMKGFNEGIQEIRRAARLMNIVAPINEDDDIKKKSKSQKQQIQPTSKMKESTGKNTGLKNVKEAVKISTRIRKPSSRVTGSDFIFSPTIRQRTNSKSTSDTQALNQNQSNTVQNSMDSAAIAPVSAIESFKRGRLRTESNCSTGSNASKRVKRVSYSNNKFDFGALDFDPLLNAGTDSVFPMSLMDDTSTPNQSHQQQQGASTASTGIDDAPLERTRARRRTRSRFLEDLLMSPGKSPFRDRSRSISSNGGRSRLISTGGYSDAFEDLLDSGIPLFNPNDLMAAIDQLPSEDSDRPLIHEDSLSMSTPLKNCCACGCQCELIGLKWRCTNKLCMKWNGVYKAYPIGMPDEESASTTALTGKSSEQLEIERAVDAIKQEASNFEEEFSQKQQFQQQHAGQDVHMQGSNNHNGSNYCDIYPTHEQRQRSEHTPLMEGLYVGSASSSTGGVASAIKQEFYPPGGSFQRFDAFGRAHASGVDTLQYIAGTLFNANPKNGAQGMYQQQQQMMSGYHQHQSQHHLAGMEYGVRKNKVEKTPPIRADGRRLCALCSGEVRPQMCGGNKHRWRCVDKKCRKWYGWVLSCDKIPNDLGKKGRWKDLVVKARPGMPFDEESFAAGTLSAPQFLAPSKRIGRPPKVFVEDDPNRDKIRTKYPPISDSDPSYRKKYQKRRRYEDIDPKRPISPLTLRQMSYEPSALERHSRWWLATRRRAAVEMSPPRDFPTSIFSNVATFRLISSAMLTAAETRADDAGSVDGTLDLLMDALAASMAPLLSLVTKLPGFNTAGSNAERAETVQKLWRSSSIHTPMF